MDSLIGKKGKEKFKDSILDTSIELFSNDIIKEPLEDLGDLARCIPVIKYYYDLRKGIISIQDHLFMKKVFRFIYELKNSDSNNEFVNKFKVKLQDNKKLQDKVVEKALIYLELFDEEIKADIFAKIFREFYTNPEVDWTMFNELSMILNRMFIYDIKVINYILGQNNKLTTKRNIIENINSNINVDAAIQRLISLGLININESGVTWAIIDDYKESIITISNLGSNFIRYGKLEDIKYNDLFA